MRTGSAVTSDAWKSIPHAKHDLWIKAIPILIKDGLLSHDDLERVAEMARQKDGMASILDVLEEVGVCSRAEIVSRFAISAGVPFCVLDPSMIQHDAAHGLDDAYLSEHQILPISSTEGWITIAMERFFDLALIDDVGSRCGMRVQVIAATADNIESTRKETTYHASAGRPVQFAPGFDGIMSDFFDDDVRVIDEDSSAEDETDLAAASDSPVINLVNRLITGAVDMHASDIHIEPEGDDAMIRYRIDGALLPVATPSRRMLPAIISRIKILANMDIAERRLPQDGAFTVTASECMVELRVSTMATKFGEKAVLRLTARDHSDIDLSELGMDQAMLDRFSEAMRLPTGLILVTGPTGSGKTTTLYAALRKITTSDRNVSTVEDPVERRINGASQFQINEKAGFSFSRALRSLLRQDPDTIMVGEVRDGETASLVVQAAMTGHLVLSTLHTNDAFSAIGRLVDMGVEPFLVSATLRCVLAQRLVRCLCPDCRHTVSLDPKTTRMILGACEITDPLVAWEADGCSSCVGRGYRGRIGVFELLAHSEADLTEFFVHRRAQLIAPSHTMFTDAVRKAIDGRISMRHILECVPRPCPTPSVPPRPSTTEPSSCGVAA